MDIFSLCSTHHSRSPPVTASTFAGIYHPVSASTTTSLALSMKSLPESDKPTTSSPFSGDVRRPGTHKALKTSSSSSNLKPQNSKTPRNPLKNLVNPSSTVGNNSETITDKLWLTSKLSPPQPPPLAAPPQETFVEEKKIRDSDHFGSNELQLTEFKQEGKIFVGNLPIWIKKDEVSEFFRQFGPIKNAILIKGHNDTDRNVGFGFIIYGGPTAAKSAMKAVEFDGVEFHGRILTVKLDDGRRMKARSEERARWVEGEESDGVEYRSKWHEERECSRRDFRKVLETQPENWQAVVRAFERIKKVLLLNIPVF